MLLMLLTSEFLRKPHHKQSHPWPSAAEVWRTQVSPQALQSAVVRNFLRAVTSLAVIHVTLQVPNPVSMLLVTLLRVWKIFSYLTFNGKLKHENI